MVERGQVSAQGSGNYRGKCAQAFHRFWNDVKNVLELHPVGMSLEEVFLKLTTREEEVAA